MLALYLLLTAALSVLLTLYCIQQPQQLTWNNKTIKYVNKPFKPKTNQLVRQRRMRRRIRVLDTSSSSGYEPSTSGGANRDSDATAQRSRPTPGPSVSSPYWGRPGMDGMNHSEDEIPPPPYSSLRDEIPPPPYSSLRRSSGSSRSSTNTIRLGEDSEDKQQLIFRGDSSDSE